MNGIKKFTLTIVACAALCVTLGITGCGTTPATKIAQADQPLITAVNDAMTEWRDYVNAGKATAAQVEQVKEAYEAYYDAQLALKAIALKLSAAETDPTVAVSQADKDAAMQAVSDAEGALLSLVNNFLRKL